MTVSIGGFDFVLLAPQGVCAGDVILRACRRFWQERECFFQDASSESVYSLRDQWVWDEGTASTEFFVFRDAKAAKSWTQSGAVPSNRNTMLHFLVGETDPSNPGLIEVTMVFDRPTKEIRKLIEQLKASFAFLMPMRRGAA